MIKDVTSDGLIPDTPINEGKTLFAPNVTLRVAEARVEDIGRALARLAASDLVKIGSRPGEPWPLPWTTRTQR